MGLMVGGLAAGMITYKIVKPEGVDWTLTKEQIFGKVPADTAKPNLETYRNNGAYTSMAAFPRAKVRCVTYDSLGFVGYFNNDFSSFIRSRTPKPNYHWEVGVYPMVCSKMFEGNRRPRLGVYFIPTMYKTDPAQPGDLVIDYMTAKDGSDAIYYIADTLRRQNKILGDDDTDFIFDEGHLWP